MKKSLGVLSLIMFVCGYAFAQDTTMLKQQATKMVLAVVNNDYSAIVDGMYPKVLTMVGGKQKMLQIVKTSIEKMGAEGVKILSAEIGSPGEFYKAGSELHCLLPERITMKVEGGKVITNSSLLAISMNGGTKWYFLDINESSRKNLPLLFPAFNKSLVVPEQSQPEFQAD